jgi:hypothetical protein
LYAPLSSRQRAPLSSGYLPLEFAPPSASPAANAVAEQVLKTLETRKLVKPVKSHAAKNKKMYLLYNLEASKEITGGTFYSGQVLPGHRADPPSLARRGPSGCVLLPVLARATPDIDSAQ